MPEPTIRTLRPPRMPATSPDGRRGRPFCVRLDDVERNKLAELHKLAEPEMPWRPHRHRSLGSFLVWAALRWQPGQQKLPGVDDKLRDGVGRRLGKPKLPKRRRGPQRRRALKKAGRK